MPQLKRLACTVQWADTGAPFQEYGTVYGDGVVESFIVVPSKPQSFSIRLKSLSYIHEGLAMVVFVDGKYQANRNRVNLKSPKKKIPSNKSFIDFLVRQKEKALEDGVYMGREWRFDNHNIVDDPPDGVKDSHFDSLGTIEVLVLRCIARVPDERNDSDSSSAADSDALGENGSRVAAEDAEEQDNGPSNLDGAAENRLLTMTPSINKFGSDGAGDEDHAHGLDGSTYYGHQGWHSTGPPNIPPNHLQSYQAPHSTPYHQHHHGSNAQAPHPAGAHAPVPQKRVRFDLGSHNPPPPAPDIPRPPSYERLRRPASVPQNPAQDRGSMPYNHSARPGYASALPSHNYTNYGGNPFAQYQASAPQMLPGHSTPHNVPRPFFQPPFPLPAPVAPIVNMAYHVPHSHQPVTNNAYRYYSPRWPVQPPHVVYNPYQGPERPTWPTGPGYSVPVPPHPVQNLANTNSFSGDATVAGTHQQQNSNHQTQAAETSGGATWPNWTTNDSTSGPAQSNGNSGSSEPNSNTENNNKGQNWGDGGGTSNNHVDTSWDQPNDNNGADNNNNGQNSWDNNVDGGNANEMTETIRPLFGPHGQYYTYHVRGPDEPMPDAEEEPRYDVPKRIVTLTGSTKQVLPGSGYLYWKRRRSPEYVDTLEEPYARFVFKYRTKENEIGVKIDVEPTGNEAVQELQIMDKQTLIEMLMRAKSALGGKVPSPKLVPAAASDAHVGPVAVEAPSHSFLKYSLPELRRVGTNTWNENTNGMGGGNTDWDKPLTNGVSNNNDSSNWETQNTAWSSGKNNGSSWDAKPGRDKSTINWNRSCDGAAEQAMPSTFEPSANGWNQSSWSSSKQAPSTEAYGRSPMLTPSPSKIEHGSAGSSPSTLPLEQPFNSSGPTTPLMPPQFQPQGFQHGSTAATDPASQMIQPWQQAPQSGPTGQIW